MHDLNLNSMSDTLLIAIPFIAIVAMAVFRLDTLLLAPRATARATEMRRRGGGMDETGAPLVVDPDGRVSPSRPKRSN